jgi:hypothetical protein
MNRHHDLMQIISGTKYYLDALRLVFRHARKAFLRDDVVFYRKIEDFSIKNNVS